METTATHTEQPIEPYSIARLCHPKINAQQLELTPLDLQAVTESVYNRVLVELAGASLPATVYNQDEQNVTISLTAAQAAPPPTTRIYKGPTGVIPTAPSTSPGSGGGTGPGTSGSQPSQPVADIVDWDAYIMLKYQQDWQSTGYGLGDLLHTVSLLPNEQVTLELKTWETSKTQQDTEDTTDSRNVSDIKTTMSTSTEASVEDQTKTHEYVDAKASYSGFGASAEASGGWSKDVSDMHSQAQKQAQENSQQSTNEYRQSHKVKISLSRETGSEDKTTRKLQNLNQEYTLNVNYFELLHQYNVKLTLYEVDMVVLGAEPDLNQSIGFMSWWTDIPQNITLGQMIQYIGLPGWIDDFVMVNGVSPIKLLRQAWSAPLYYAAPAPGDVDWSVSDAVVTTESRADFQTTMLGFVQPSPGWVEPDASGALRWGYVVRPGKEAELLQFLYTFLPSSVQQMVARALQSKMDPALAPLAAVNRYREAVIPSFRHVLATQSTTIGTIKTAPPLVTTEVATIQVPGLFYGTELQNLDTKIANVVDQFTTEWKKAQDLTNPKSHHYQPPITWTVVLPTQGTYADLSLGLCSGAEDYLAVQRQFDLELKRLQIEQAKLQVARMALENQMLAAGKPLSSLTIENPSAGTTIDLNVGMPTTPTTIAITGGTGGSGSS